VGIFVVALGLRAEPPPREPRLARAAMPTTRASTSACRHRRARRNRGPPSASASKLLGVVSEGMLRAAGGTEVVDLVSVKAEPGEIVR